MDTKVNDKQQAILDAAIEVFAERGFWNTPTALISKTAGVAEGTLFNYFATKDALIHAVYLLIKRELAKRMLSDIPNNADLKAQSRHIWDRYIEWGLAYPSKFKVIQQLCESYPISPEIQVQSQIDFARLEHLTSSSVANGQFQAYPVAYLGALLESQAVLTIRFITNQPDQAVNYQEIGFEVLWRCISC